MKLRHLDSNRVVVSCTHCTDLYYSRANRGLGTRLTVLVNCYFRDRLARDPVSSRPSRVIEILYQWTVILYTWQSDYPRHIKKISTQLYTATSTVCQAYNRIEPILTHVTEYRITTLQTSSCFNHILGFCNYGT